MEFNAKAMKEIADKNDAENTASEVEDIKKKIEIAATRGETYTDYKIRCRGTIAELTKRGFVVNNFQHTHYRISWE